MNRTTTLGAFGAMAAIAAAGVATGASASADVLWQMPTTCTIAYHSTDPSISLPADATFQNTLVAAYATHGNLSTAADGSTYVHSVNENTQITIPANVYADLYKTGVVSNPSVSASEYFTVNGKPAAKPFKLSVPASYQTEGVFVVSASGPATDVPATAADKASDGLVKLVHTNTSVIWQKGTVTATLMCGDGVPSTPSTSSSSTPNTSSTSAPTTSSNSTPSSTAPATSMSSPSTSASSSASSVSAPSSSSTTSAAPTAGSSPTSSTPAKSSEGPKIQTDYEANHSNLLGAGFAVAGVVALGGAIALGRRRSS